MINTNGLAIDKHDISILLNSLTELSISVDSINPETYGKIHGNGKNLEKVIENIKKCIEYKKEFGATADIVVRFTENELNENEYPKFKKFFENLGVDKINYTKVHSFAGIKKELSNKHDALFCNHPKQIVNFTFTGELTTCCINWHFEPLFGNIKNYTIKELWEGEKYADWLKKRLDYIPCNNCNGLGNKAQKRNLKYK